MASNWTVCGVCDSLEITQPSVVWCSECDEGLCTECDKHHAVSKASRTHNTLQIAEYKQLPTDILKIAHTCSKHNEKFQTYCKKHDCPCCHRCVIETHNDCKDIVAIVDIIKDVKSSNALSDIELMLVEVAENLENITKDRKDNVTSLTEQRRRIENEIQQIRIKINSHLDQIQEELLEKLYELDKKERQKIEDLLTALEIKKKEINVHKTSLSNVKKHASDLQTFLFIKQMENKVNVDGRFVETLASSDSLKQIVLSLKDDESFQKIFMCKSIGQVVVEIKHNGVIITRKKGKEAQLEVLTSKSPRLIKDIKLNLTQSFETGLSETTGCLILPDGRLVLSCRGNHLVKLFNSDGIKDFGIVLKPCFVIDITFIPEDNTIAATSGANGKQLINIIDIKDRKVSRKMSVNSFYYGVVHHYSKLITCARSKGLHILENGSSEIIDEFDIKDMSSFSYIAALDNNIYYTNPTKCTVTCCDMKGKELWTFNDESILECPKGITVDEVGNVYVANESSDSVIGISSDGKRCLELLSAKDGLHKPRVLHYDRSTNQLLVGNERETALLFKVESKN